MLVHVFLPMLLPKTYVGHSQASLVRILNRSAAPPDIQIVVERLVDTILTAKQREPEADVSALQREIDELVYALYDLTPEEIKIVEGATK